MEERVAESMQIQKVLVILHFRKVNKSNKFSEFKIW
jgi:hypothetical protein